MSLFLGGILQAHPQEPPEVYSNVHPPSVGETTGGSYPNGKRLDKLCATATGGIHPPLGKRVSAPQVVVQVAPQVDVPNSGRVLQARPQEPPEVYSNLLPPSVGETTGGIYPHAVRHKYLCPTGGKCPILLGGIMQARPQEPPEVYSNVLPPSVGETTGGIHPMPSGINISAPPEVNIPSTAGRCQHRR